LLRTVLICLAAAALLGGCGDSEGAGGGRLNVVATTPQLGDFARQVGGDRVRVETILDAKTDPHDYEPRRWAAAPRPT
jgi:ABC-type Zn uptake system ZnuABC Zn-binding protein ZnuA